MLLSTFAFAEEDPCSLGSAMATSACQGPKWKAAEQELQASYDLQVAHVKEQSPHLLPDLVQAQRTWIRFREQYCSVYARDRVEGSSWTGFWEAECMADEARRRTQSIKHMLEVGY
jgi:uncharacterized protein YecT (DUF1311 family)